MSPLKKVKTTMWLIHMFIPSFIVLSFCILHSWAIPILVEIEWRSSCVMD